MNTLAGCEPGPQTACRRQEGRSASSRCAPTSRSCESRRWQVAWVYQRVRYSRDPPAELGGVRGRRDGYTHTMRIGSSIGLIALGLILALAVSVNVRGIDLTLVGW